MTNSYGGRETAAEREVVLIRDDDVLERPKPPAELGAEEAIEWIAICNAVPAGYFAPAMWMMLAQYCRHVVIARHLAELMQRCVRRKRFNAIEYRALAREHRQEGLAIYAHLRGMRLTHLANYAKDRTPLPEATAKPWLS